MKYLKKHDKHKPVSAVPLLLSRLIVQYFLFNESGWSAHFLSKTDLSISKENILYSKSYIYYRNSMFHTSSSKLICNLDREQPALGRMCLHFQLQHHWMNHYNLHTHMWMSSYKLQFSSLVDFGCNFQSYLTQKHCTLLVVNSLQCNLSLQKPTSLISIMWHVLCQLVKFSNSKPPSGLQFHNSPIIS
jgi:hypothetical protein